MGEVTVSVCMASYNGGRFIHEQLISILQCSDVDEVIVSDDGSTDDTLKIIKGIADDRVVLLQGPRRGIARNFENAILHARGQYIFLSDQDDVWQKDRVSLALDAFNRSSCILTVSNVTIVDELCGTERIWQNGRVSLGLVSNIFRNKFLGCSIAFDRELMNFALPFPSDSVAHDWWIGLCAAMMGQCVFIPESGLFYRRHGGNVSTTTDSSVNPIFEKFRLRFEMVSFLAARGFLKNSSLVASWLSAR